MQISMSTRGFDGGAIAIDARGQLSWRGRVLDRQPSAEQLQTLRAKAERYVRNAWGERHDGPGATTLTVVDDSGALHVSSFRGYPGEDVTAELVTFLNGLVRTLATPEREAPGW